MVELRAEEVVRVRRSDHGLDLGKLFTACGAVLCMAAAPASPSQSSLSVSATVTRPTSVASTQTAGGTAAVTVSSDYETNVTASSAYKVVEEGAVLLETFAESKEPVFVTISF